MLAAADLSAPLVKWGRWYLADRSTRLTSVDSRITIRDYAKQLANQQGLPALEEALDFDPANPLIYSKLASLLASSRPETARLYQQISESKPISNDQAFVEKYVYDRGYFGKLTSDNPVRWKEGSTNTTDKYYFEELKRDDQVILLRDASRRVSDPNPAGRGRVQNFHGRWCDVVPAV